MQSGLSGLQALSHVNNNGGEARLARRAPVPTMFGVGGGGICFETAGPGPTANADRNESLATRAFVTLKDMIARSVRLKLLPHALPLPHVFLASKNSMLLLDLSWPARNARLCCWFLLVHRDGYDC